MKCEWKGHAPAASFLIYWLRAVESWFEFSSAKQTFLMCVGMSSMIPGSQSGGVLAFSGTGLEKHCATANRATNTVTLKTLLCIFLELSFERKIRYLLGWIDIYLIELMDKLLQSDCMTFAKITSDSSGLKASQNLALFNVNILHSISGETCTFIFWSWIFELHSINFFQTSM